MSVMLRTAIVTTQLVAVFTDTMTPEQCREAARNLRLIDADPSETKLFQNIAGALDEYATMRESEEARH